MKHKKVLSEEHKRKIRESCKNAMVVHHINGNHFDDRPENRILFTVKEHAQIHILQGDIKPYGGGSHNGCVGRKQSKVGRKQSKITKKRISDAHKGKTMPEEIRKKISLWHIGKKLSEEHKRRIREGCKKAKLQKMKGGKTK